MYWIFCIVFLPITSHAGLLEDVRNDYKHYYKAERIYKTALVLGLGSVFANSHWDQSLRNRIQEKTRSGGTDDWSKIVTDPINIPLFKKTMGMSLYAGGAKVARYTRTKTLESWSNHSIRTVLLLAPQQGLLTQLTGGRRPTECRGSKWGFPEVREA